MQPQQNKDAESIKEAMCSILDEVDELKEIALEDGEAISPVVDDYIFTLKEEYFQLYDDLCEMEEFE